MNELDELSGREADLENAAVGAKFDGVGADRSVHPDGSAESCDAGAVTGYGRLEGVGGVASLRSLVFVAALVAMAGCKDFGKKRSFGRSDGKGGTVELYAPPSASRSGRGGAFLIDPSTGKIIFGDGVEGKEAGGKKGVQPEKVAGKKEDDESDVNVEGSAGGVSKAGGGRKGVGDDCIDRTGGNKGVDAASTGKRKGAASGGVIEKAGSGAVVPEDPRRKVIEEYIRAVFKPLITSSDIVLPSKDVEREVTFTSSGREVSVRIKIPRDHLVVVRNRLAGNLSSSANSFFSDTDKFMDEGSLRERLLAERAGAVGGSISGITKGVNPDWVLPVSVEDPVFIALTNAVVEKFSTKRGKMQAIADFAVAAVKYKRDSRRMFVKFPLLTLADGFGDCKDFSPLCAAMAKVAGIDCVFADFKDEQHLDIACDVDGEGAAFELDGRKYEWINVTTFIVLYVDGKVGTNYDGIGVLPKKFKDPEILQPVFGKPFFVKDLEALGRLRLNEHRQDSGRSVGRGR